MDLKYIQLKQWESQKSNVKVVTYENKKSDKKVKRIKKHSRTSPDVQFKELSLAKQKLNLERTMSELRKPFPKNPDQKT